MLDIFICLNERDYNPTYNVKMLPEQSSGSSNSVPLNILPNSNGFK